MTDARQGGGTRWMPLAQALALAEEHRCAGRLAEAEHLCRQILQARPDHHPALHLLGIVAHQAGNSAEAIKLLRRATAINRDIALYHSNLGEVCRLAGRIDEAIAEGKRALALESHSPEAHSNLGIAYYDRGDYVAAAAEQEQAIALAPGFAEAHSNLGNALRAQKRYDEAVAALRHAVAIKPGFADAWNNLGTVLRDQKRIDEAEAAYRQSLALAPNNAEALDNLALALQDLERYDEAAALLVRAAQLNPNSDKTLVYLASVLLDQDKPADANTVCARALALRPDNPDALNTMGRVAFERDDLDAAIAYGKRALALKPDLADAYNNIGNAHKEAGRLAEAHEAFIKAHEIDPNQSGILLNLADTITFTPDDPVRPHMEALLAASERLSTKEQTHLHFALGKAYADIGDAARSFAHLAQGNALKRSTIAYDEAASLRLYDEIASQFTAEFLRAREGMGDPSRTPIFVLGMPRSGTTLVEQILASHPSVHGAGELMAFSDIVRELPGRFPEVVSMLDARQLRAIGERYVARLSALAPNAPRITDKMPSNFFFIGLIHLALPNAVIIHTPRDPVDTCFSCFSKLFSAEQNFSYDLGELGRYYRRYQALMAHWRRVLPPGRVLEVQYEDVVADLETQARRIIAHCGLEWDPACLAFHQTRRPVRTASATQVRRPIYRTSLGRWRAYEAFLKPLVAALSS